MADAATDPGTVVQPRTYLGWTLMAALVCFLPFGAAAGYFGWRTADALAAGHAEQAERASRAARRWLIAAVVTGVVLDALIVLVLLLLGAFPSA